MTWLDIGNGWRNLYLLSVLLQITALGTFFAVRRFPLKTNRSASFLCGAACVPLCEYLWMLLVAIAFPKLPRLIIIAVPPLLSVIGLLIIFLLHRKQICLLPQSIKTLGNRIHHSNRSLIIAVCFALAMIILLLPPCVRMMSSMETISGGDSGEYMGLALRWCEDRDFSKLLEKEETVGHYRGHSHFPSLELLMSYGLMHTGGEMGYPNDKAVFTALGLLIFFVAFAYIAILTVVCGRKKQWIALGVLCFNLVPSLCESAQWAPRDIWRILALLIAVLFLCGLNEKGKVGSYLLKLFGMILICFTVMSSHVVCFIVLPFMVVAWVLWRFASALTSGEGKSGKALLRSIGLALGGALGTIAGFSGNIWCYLRWGTLSPFRLMDTFSETPWYDLYMQKEYKLTETTTTVDFFTNKNQVLMSHATNLGIWGFRLALIAFIIGIVWVIAVGLRRKKGMLVSDEMNQKTVNLLGCSLLVLLTLLPVTGFLDTPLYSFSGSFLKMARYTLQWYLLCGMMICAFGATLSEIWRPLWRKVAVIRLKDCYSVRIAWIMRKLPNAICVFLCLIAFVDGTSQKGYSESFYRQSRGIVEDESILLDNGFQERYGVLMSVMDEVEEDEKLLITRVGYQYPLKSRGYLIAANNIVSVLTLSEEEIGDALAEMNVAAVASEPDFWDNRYFGLSTLSDWLNQLPKERILETDTMRIYFVSEELYERCKPLIAQLQTEE